MAQIVSRSGPTVSDESGAEAVHKAVRARAVQALGRLRGSIWSLGPKGIAGLIIVVLIVVAAIAAPIVQLHDPYRINLLSTLKPPVFEHGGSWSYPLGTNSLGEDMWSRLVWALRVSLLISVPAVACGVVIGVIVGSVAGYFGGIASGVLMRLTDVQMAFPTVILAITILSVTRPTPLVLIIVLGIAIWPIYARVIRGIVMIESTAEYVICARAYGAGHLRILRRYVLRDIIPSAAVMSTLDVATVIVLAALLSFIGLGIQPPTPSLGNIMADGKDYLATGQWWIVTEPGIFILIILLGFNLLGTALQAQRQK